MDFQKKTFKILKNNNAAISFDYIAFMPKKAKEATATKRKNQLDFFQQQPI